MQSIAKGKTLPQSGPTPHDEAIWSLRGARFLANLPPRELRALSPFLRTEEHRRGEFLFHTGDKADRLYILAKGTVKVSVVSRDGDERILDVFRPGDVFGELFLMTSTRRIFSAEAMTETTVYTMTEKAFESLMSLRSDLRRDFIRHLVRQQRRALLRLQSLLHVKAGPRLLAVLLDLGERVGEPAADGWRLTAPLTQDDLAKMVGLNRSTVNVLINHYRRQGILSGNTKRLVIHRVRAMTALEMAGVLVA